MKQTKEILIRAKQAAPSLSLSSSEQKNEGLKKMAESLLSHTAEILAANSLDVENARQSLSPVMLDRLILSEERIQSMAKGILDLIPLPDPVGEISSETLRPNGIVIRKVSVPLGVVAIIYESRPNVTSDGAALALKSGNVCILRSGKDAWRSADAITKALREGIETVGFNPDCIQLIEDTSHSGAEELMTANGYVDLLIPRGGAGLINTCLQKATVPCIQTGTGICHVYVDRHADLQKALSIVENAKTSRPSVCNAAEVCLIHADIAEQFLPLLHKRLVEERIAEGKTPVELRLDERARRYIPGTAAGENDFDREFLDYILAIRVVDDVEQAIEHIGKHSSGHSEAIVTEDRASAEYFLRRIDSAAVYWNASTRFTDGGEFGLGCEMGISTQKLHARGPMGLKELCSYKYVICGDGQTR